MNIFTEVKIPVENVNDLTAKVITWRVANGSTVKKGQALGELETSKATFEVPAPCDGVVEYSWSEGSEVPIGEILCRIASESESPLPVSSSGPPTSNEGKQKLAVSQTSANPDADSVSSPIFSKKAEKLIAQAGLSLDLFKGMGLVKASDVQEKLPGYVRPLAVRSPAQATVVEETNKAPSQINEDEVEIVSLPRAKLFENRELLAAARTMLKSSISLFCPAVGLETVCKQQTPPVGRLPLILYETAKLLKQFRHLNAFFADDRALLYRHVHLGFAVDMGRGLKVLVISSADQLSFSQLAAEFDELLIKYATDTLQISNVTGSTFTVTDLTQEGVFTFDPLINNRQAAILGIGGEIAGSNSFTAGFMLNCAFDHRLIGGKQVAEFLRELSNRLVAHRKSFNIGPAEGNPLSCSRCLQTVGELSKFGAMLVRSVEPEGYLCSNCIRGLI
ncbi:MAG: hypothetical protein JWQ71_113 [Pedosphaera sp.]|nr:hypothetical protein [Pedosphaera sp.]